ncbi:hypothetical protein [Chitinophaga caeni]|nr:hypothetical protein [Chitinophaga caeni]
MKSTYKWLFAVLGCILALAACKKDYYDDSGTHNGKFDGNIMQYLESNPYYFSDVVKAIDLAGLRETMENETVTFFAPGNVSFDSTIYYTNRELFNIGQDTIRTLDQVPGPVWKAMLSRYLFKDKRLLNDYQQFDPNVFNTYPGQFFNSYLEEPMHIGVFYHDEGGAKYVGYRQLQLSYSRDYSISPIFWTTVNVASVNIEPTNGAVHALQFSNHRFGFIVNDFYLLIRQYGLNGQ